MLVQRAFLVVPARSHLWTAPSVFHVARDTFLHWVCANLACPRTTQQVTWRPVCHHLHAHLARSAQPLVLVGAATRASAFRAMAISSAREARANRAPQTVPRQPRCPTSGIQHVYLVRLALRHHQLAILASATLAATTQPPSPSVVMRTHLKRSQHRVQLFQGALDVDPASTVKGRPKCVRGTWA
jgi:hypothetical protein